MAYIFNKYISPNKTIISALTQIYGIGTKRAKEIANFLCVNQNKRFYKLDANEIVKLSKYITTSSSNPNTRKNYLVGGVLQKNLKENINKKIKIKSYQGIRHKNKLPVRGQRTHTNAKTQRRFRIA